MSNIEYPHLKILIVDDKKFVRKMVGQILNQLGVRDVIFAESGQEAIALLGAQSPRVDVVFTDLKMAHGDGVEFTRRIAEMEQPPALVFISGAGGGLLMTAGNIARARGIQVLGAIEKPIGIEAVARALGRLAQADPLRHVANHEGFVRRDLEQALEGDQLLLHYQPKVHVTSGEIAGFESLVRWQHPIYGLVMPLDFIGLAEGNGLIKEVTDRVCLRAIERCAAWNSEDFAAKMSINLSTHMLNDLGIPDRLYDQVTALGVDPGQIVLEVTESGLFQNEADTLEILARLNLKGFALSIDDFGTGYSSLDQLQRVPFSELKIDRAFVAGAAESNKKRAILESSVSLGHKLGMSVVAEGAESDEDMGLLAEVGVDLAQGYAVSKPMPADSIALWAQAWPTSHRRFNAHMPLMVNALTGNRPEAAERAP